MSESLYGSSKYRCLIKAVRGTWNFVWQQATLVQGCTSEAHLNMDVNLCRLPDENSIIPKFLVPLAGIMWHLPSTDSTAIQPKQPERQFTNKQKTHSKNCWHFVSDKEKFSCESHNIFRKNFPHSQAPMDYSGICPILV